MYKKIELNGENMTLSQKVNHVNNLYEFDDAEHINNTVEVLELFTEKERLEIFGHSDILWILRCCRISEIKKKAQQYLNRPELKIGDIAEY